MNKHVLLLIPVLLSFLTGCSTSTQSGADTILAHWYETEHFVFHFAEDQEDLAEVFEILEENYVRICTNWDVHPAEKVQVYIYPDISSFHKAVNLPKDPQWAVGICTMDGKLLFTSPNSPGEVHDFDGILEVAVHEFTHYITAQINPVIPTWLNEGIAIFEAGQFTSKDEEIIRKHVAEGLIPTFFEMEYFWMEAAEKKASYDFSYTIIVFIEEKYGMEKLRQLAERPMAYKEILGVKKRKLYKEWLEYLKENYS